MSTPAIRCPVQLRVIRDCWSVFCYASATIKNSDIVTMENTLSRVLRNVCYISITWSWVTFEENFSHGKPASGKYSIYQYWFTSNYNDLKSWAVILLEGLATGQVGQRFQWKTDLLNEALLQCTRISASIATDTTVCHIHIWTIGRMIWIKTFSEAAASRLQVRCPERRKCSSPN